MEEENNVNEPVVTPAEEQLTKQQRNWRAREETFKRELQERETENQRLREEYEALKSASRSAQNNDDLVTYGQLDSVKKEAVETATKAIERKLSERSEKEAIDNLIKDYPDITKVVRDEYIERLSEENPRLYKAITENPSRYAQAISFYNALKPYVTNKETKRQQEIDRNDAKITENQAKTVLGGVASSAPIVPQQKPWSQMSRLERQVHSKTLSQKMSEKAKQANRF
jgi:hypothetical protein